ncbi:putative inorganic phosphate cotransporter isoform X2 [Eupeodes corollae]|uniref:putative inorganic phosphate cotransporter isoform X2 n=1 Tax=Eupeodes corollae TaxID=290404 RepID=UPI002490D1B6|nr:putative inorganic phosphate cotransporter isoform X2 [Eupeodes corollae]
MVVDEKYKGPLLGARHLQAILINLAMLTSYLQRVNISVTLIAMTDSKTTNPYFHEFDWNEKERSYIISSFFWGYILTQFPGGFMSRKLGVKATIMIAMLGSSVLNLLISVSVPWGQWQVYCVIRFGQGIIAASDLGWPGISYVYGGFGIGFCVIWMIFAENSPSVARFITADERKYIISSQAGTGGETKPTVPIPWKAIFTSVPFISLLVVRIGHNWGSSTMQTQTPAYLHGVLSMSIVSNAFYSSLPHLAAWILSFVYFTIAELVLQKKWASLSVVRKTINTISMWIPALLLIGIGFLDEKQKALAIVLLTLNEGLNSGNTVGSLLNLIDLSPNHTAILTAVLNCITNIIPMITPLVVGIIVYDETQRTLWQIVFVIASAFFFFGNLQYLFFAATNVQPWNDGEFLTKNDNKQKI